MVLAKGSTFAKILAPSIQLDGSLDLANACATIVRITTSAYIGITTNTYPRQNPSYSLRPRIEACAAFGYASMIEQAPRNPRRRAAAIPDLIRIYNRAPSFRVEPQISPSRR